MKFSSIKKTKSTLLVITMFFLAHTPLLRPVDTATEKQLECGKKVGATLALCLFKVDDNLTFLNYIEQWKKIINEYRSYFDQTTVNSAMKALDNIESYVKAQYAQKKYVDPTKVAAFLTRLKESLPKEVINQLDAVFEQYQLKLLKRSKPLGTLQLLAPLSNRLNQKKVTS